MPPERATPPGGKREEPEPRVKPNYVMRRTLRVLVGHVLAGVSVALAMVMLARGSEDPLLAAFTLLFAGAAGLVQAVLGADRRAYRSAVRLVNALELPEWCLVGDLMVARLKEGALLALRLPLGPIFILRPSYARERAVRRWRVPGTVVVSGATKVLAGRAVNVGGCGRVTKAEVYRARFTVPSLKAPGYVVEGFGYVIEARVKVRGGNELPECLGSAVKAVASLL